MQLHIKILETIKQLSETRQDTPNKIQNFFRNDTRILFHTIWFIVINLMFLMITVKLLRLITISIIDYYVVTEIEI